MCICKRYADYILGSDSKRYKNGDSVQDMHILYLDQTVLQNRNGVSVKDMQIIYLGQRVNAIRMVSLYKICVLYIWI